MSRNNLFLTGFKSICPDYFFSQEEGLKWIENAHIVSDRGELKGLIEKMVLKFCCKPSHIGKRGSSIPDFTASLNEKAVYPQSELSSAPGLGKRSEIYGQIVDTLFEKFYPSKKELPPSDLIHERPGCEYSP